MGYWNFVFPAPFFNGLALFCIFKIVPFFEGTEALQQVLVLWIRTPMTEYITDFVIFVRDMGFYF